MSTLIAPTATLVVPLEDLKTQLRYSPADTSQDKILTNKIKAATLWIERYCGISMINKGYRSSFSKWYGSLPIAVYPYQSGIKVIYDTDDQNNKELTADDYEVYETLEIHQVHIKTMPQLKSTALYPVRLEYVAGYGDAADDVPADLVEAVLILASTMDMVRIDTQMALGMVGHIIHTYKTEYARTL